ncbi:hypothetical protein CDL15_Pgr000279 [Punica granatum]|uniref:Apple domain-containing protein n=1 Tax=Punica granatum TaxID=22663 RepID=A0A218Y212_PUNGR|nr:hypothetical protein CDL15_Pgr000279 [Punica granatum]
MDCLASLMIGAEQNLKLIGRQNSTRRSTTNVSSQSDESFAVHLDNGNFALIDARSGNYTWESFHVPCDTLLPGMKIGINTKAKDQRYLVSWKNAADPSHGDFAFRVTSETPTQPFIWHGSSPYLRGGQVLKDADCRGLCQSNCSCWAYSFVSGIGCMVWTKDLMDMEQFSDSQEDLYLRLSDIESAQEVGGGRWQTSSTNIIEKVNDALYIFIDSKRKAELNWETRLHIIKGVARGLLYLHYFGLVRMFHSTKDLVNTRRVVGTLGYMAPEYAMGGIFSEKSDVYSFGVLLLQIVSSCKNMSFYYLGEHLNFLLTQLDESFAVLLDDGSFVLVDAKLGNYNWESFDDPCDTLLPGMKIGINAKAGDQHYLVSWKNAADPSHGDFAFGLTNETST